jgi:hypothetical protein
MVTAMPGNKDDINILQSAGGCNSLTIRCLTAMGLQIGYHIRIIQSGTTNNADFHAGLLSSVLKPLLPSHAGFEVQVGTRETNNKKSQDGKGF